MFAARFVTTICMTTLLAAGAGCGKSTTYGVSSGGTTWETAADNPVAGIDYGTATVTTLQCGSPEGVTVVVWSDLINSSTEASGADAQRAFRQVTHSNDAGTKVGFTVETTDGEVATVKLQGAQFTTTAGNLFLVSTAQGTPRVAQINQSLDEFPNEPAEIKDFASSHEEVEEFFRAAQAPPAAAEESEE